MKSNNKKKLVQISKYYYPFCGGIEAVAKQLADILKNSDYDIEVFACSTDSKSSEDIVDDIPIKRCGVFYEFKSNPLSINLINSLSKVDTDILHYQHPFVFAAIAHFIAKPKYKKLTMTYCSDIVKQKYIMKLFSPIYEKFIKEVDRIHILAPNMIESSKLLSKYKDKCVTVPYSIDLSDYDQKDEAKIQTIKTRFPDKKIILFVGRLIYYKGISVLIDAMNSVSDDSILIIIGTGKLEKDLKQQVINNNLSSKVFFEGEVSFEDINSYYQACDIFAFPSVAQSEAYGISQLEAMACGKPVINTWLHTGVNFISIDNETGLTVEPGNAKQLSEAINRLVEDETFRLILAQNARKRIEEYFNLSKNQNKYKDFFSFSN